MSKFEAGYGAEVGRRRDEVVGLTKKLRQQVASAATGSKELVALYAKLESYKAKTIFLDEALRVSRKEVTDTKCVVEERRACWDAAGARMACLKNY